MNARSTKHTSTTGIHDGTYRAGCAVGLLEKATTRDWQEAMAKFSAENSKPGFNQAQLNGDAQAAIMLNDFLLSRNEQDISYNL